MKKTVRVKIGGQEYNLRSDDEAKVRDVAAMVDTQFRMIQGNSKEQSTATLSILTALNIAEQAYDARQQQQRDKNYLASEVEKMVAYLRQSFNDKTIGEKNDKMLQQSSLQEKSQQEKSQQEKSSQEKPFQEKPQQEKSFQERTASDRISAAHQQANGIIPNVSHVR